jgi:death on curing protein
VAETGEPHFLRDAALLEMARARPINVWYYGEGADLATLAVMLLLGIAQLHPFEQGNKRTALISAIMFLRINDLDIELPNSRAFGDIIIDAVEGRFSQQILTAFFRAGIRAAN